MDGDKDAAPAKTPMIYICGECHRCVFLVNKTMQNSLSVRMRFVQGMQSAAASVVTGETNKIDYR